MKLYKVINKFVSEEYDRHEYDITVENTDKGTKYILMRSNSEHWSDNHRNTKACAILDTGDGYIFSKNTNFKELDYALAAEIHILMTFMNKKENNCLFKGIIVESEILNIYEI